MNGWKHFSKTTIASWPTEHKQCRSCGIVLPLASYGKLKHGLFGRNTVCKVCRKPVAKKVQDNLSVERRLYYSAKSRATAKGLAFDIELTDIVVPDKCPIFGTPFVKRDHKLAASLDRINPELGYTKGNVWVISNRANMMKGDSSLEELKTFAKWACEVVW